MSVHTRVYIVTPSDSQSRFDLNGTALYGLSRQEFIEKKYAKTLCTFNLGPQIDIVGSTSEYFVYRDDGNTPLIFDMYGDQLKQVDLEDATIQLKSELRFGEDLIAQVLLQTLNMLKIACPNALLLLYRY